MILHTDHANIARIEGWDISRIDAKHFRWHAELVQDGSLLLYRAGTGALHRGPDALSRNPEHRDALILARTEEWTIHRLRIRGVEKEIAEGWFDDEDPPLYSAEELEVEMGLEDEAAGQEMLASLDEAVRSGCTVGADNESLTSVLERYLLVPRIWLLPIRVSAALPPLVGRNSRRTSLWSDIENCSILRTVRVWIWGAML